MLNRLAAGLLLAVAILSAVLFLAASPDRISPEAYIVGRATAAVCFTVALSGLAVASAIARPLVARVEGPVAKPPPQSGAQKNLHNT